jgi:hypothetical protein
MSGSKEPSDARLNVARYQVDRLAGGDAIPGGPGASDVPAAEKPEGDNAGQTTMEQHAHFVEMSIQQAIRRGEFDDLPGAGKPLKNLNQIHDPDWWIRQKIENEKLTGLGPPALTLRTENAGLDDRIDSATTEKQVRELLEDFNKRVVHARRQLQGGPPVVTPPRDIDAEVASWRSRREARSAAAEQQRLAAEAALAAMTRRERRRAKRGG